MLAVLRWTLLAAVLSGPVAAPVAAQEAPPPPSDADRALLAAFGKAFVVTSRDFIEAISPRTLVSRALHGLATDPALAKPDQRRIVLAAAAQVSGAPDGDAVASLRSFGTAVDGLRKAPGGPPLDVILRAAAGGMLDGLDARTRFLPPVAAASPAGEGGAGLVVKADADGPRIIRAYPQGPAAKAGLRRDDRIVSIDGHPVRSLRLDEVAALLRGPVDSPLTLVVQRGAAAPAMFELTRAVIRIPLASGRDIDRIAFLRVETFAPGAAQGVRRLFAELQNRAAAKLRGVVLDLRGNEGGRLAEAVATADELLPPTTPIASLTGREAEGNQRFAAAAGDMAAGLPMVVLVDEETAAGSEVVAAALQAGRGAVVMGSHTAGAGLVTTVVPLPPLGTMSLTTQQIILPSGQPLKPPGLLPQVALVPGPGNASGPPAPEAPTNDPRIARLRHDIPRAPPAGEPFATPDAPERDFEVRQACAVLALLAPDAPP